MNTYDYLVTQLLTNAVQINCIVAIERIPTTAWRYSYSEVHVYGCTKSIPANPGTGNAQGQNARTPRPE